MMRDEDGSVGEAIGVRRATFTIPTDELDAIEQLRHRISETGKLLNRSEVVRAGLIALLGLPKTKLGQAATKVRKLKPGRLKEDDWVSG